MKYILLFLLLTACGPNGSNEINTPTKPCVDSLTLTWVIPDANEDESELLVDDIVGYNLYYGTESGVYDAFIFVEPGNVITYTYEDLIPKNTYFFAIKTVGKYGTSDYSEEVSRVYPERCE